MKRTYTDIIAKIETYIEKELSEKRYHHSIYVGKMSKFLASKFKVDEDRAYLAGISHDIARELDIRETNNYLLKIKNYSSEFYIKPILYHGPVGALLLKDKFNIIDPDILESVACHSFGNANMSILAKVVYVSDYISEDRTHIDDSYRQEILKLDLNSMIINITNKTIKYLESKNEIVLPETKNMMLSLGIRNEKE
ncbi:MAG: bis(5'-nucleosyl)-tetraphosphatase (symmetrical) YqeK [Spirochaetales bacterium]|nr:bis(5'-nucleosyl)-tetraphosphatase (symmetrical) YqeK [Spirochaetales bacterium]